MDKFIEVARGNIRNRNLIVHVKRIPHFLNLAIENDDELYFSYYQFNKEIEEHFKVYKSVKSYKGNVYLDRLLFDIDKSEDTDAGTLQRARIFYDELIEEWKIDEEQIQVWFSGRGYHIYTYDFFGFTGSDNLNVEVKATLEKYFPEADSIYDRTRLIRAGYTKNEKVGLYKTPLMAEEFKSLKYEQIKLLASKPRLGFKFAKPSGPAVYQQLIVKQQEVTDDMLVLDNPGRRVTCMQKLYIRGERRGSRHTDLLRLASWLRRNGTPETATITLLQQWGKSLEPYEVKRLVHDTYIKQYKYGCEDKVMKEHCDEQCMFYKHKNYTVSVPSAEDSEKKYVNFIRTDFTGRSFNLKDVFPWMREDFFCYPQEFITLIGDTGLGKTALVQNIIVNIDIPVLVFSFEIGEGLFYRRNVQIKHNMNKQEVMSHYREAHNGLSKGLEHIRIVDTGMNLDSLVKLTMEMEPALVVIDTIEDIYGTEGRDENTFIAPLVRGLDEMKKAQNLIVLAIHHISKGAALSPEGRTKRLTVHSGKGSSAAEQKADKLLALEPLHPNIDSRKQKGRRFSSLKARDEAPFDIEMEFDWNTFRFGLPSLADKFKL